MGCCAMNTKIKFLIITTITLLGLFLRIYNLSESPPSLNWDEAALGYNAYSLSLTGKDEYGAELPLFLRSFDEYKSAIAAYLMIPAIKYFGLNEFGVRIVAVILSAASIFLIYLLTAEVFKKELIGFLAAFMFAIEPWSVHYSRTYQEAAVANFFFLLGVVLYVYSKKIHKLFPLSLLSLFLSLLSYNSNKVVAFLFIACILYNRFKAKEKITNLSKLIILFFSVVVVYEILCGRFFPRVQSTSIIKIWQDFSLVNNLTFEHSLSSLQNFIFHNRHILFLKEVIGRYMAYFSPANLFLREPLEPTSKIPGLSIFYPFEFVFWLTGLLAVMQKPKKYALVIFIILISALPPALTWNWFQPNRVMSLFSFYSIIAAFGIYTLLKVVKKPKVKKLIYIGIIFYCFLNAFFLVDAISVQIPIQNKGAWQPGFRETVPRVFDYYKDYDRVIIETPQAQPYIFYLFYGAYPPEDYHRDILEKDPGTPRKVYDFGKFEFRKINWEEDKRLEKTLFVGQESNFSQSADLIAEGYFYFQPKDKNGVAVSTLVGTK